jgi:hypothetical protein
MVLGELMVTGNVVTAAAYYILTVQLILFVRSNKVCTSRPLPIIL